MSQNAPQDYGTHRRFVPLYHFVASSLLLAALIHAVIGIVTGFSVANVIHLVTVVAVILLFWYTRAFALVVQDRVIRLEEQLRLEGVLSEDLKPQIGNLATRHLIALRFAADNEVEALVRRVLDGTLTDPEEIKRQITTWRPDQSRI